MSGERQIEEAMIGELHRNPLPPQNKRRKEKRKKNLPEIYSWGEGKNRDGRIGGEEGKQGTHTNNHRALWGKHSC